MIAEIGHYALILALMIALLQATIPLAGTARRDLDAMSFGSYAAGLQVTLAVIAFACLSQLHAIGDVSVEDLAAVSQNTRGTPSNMAAITASTGGVLLLVFALLSAAAAALALRKMALIQKANLLGAVAVVSLPLLALLVFSVNPFARSEATQISGALRGFAGFSGQTAERAAAAKVTLIASFTLPPVAGTGPQGLSDQNLKGQLTLLNVFASWCPGCRVEHPLLMKIAGDKAVPFYGLNWKDKPGEGARFLERHNNPYLAAGDDFSGRAGVAMGVTGVPETLLIDATGRILYRHLGPLDEDTWKTVFERLIARVKRGS